MKALVSSFWQDECGATAIEYGLIAAGISLAIIAAVNGLGTTLNEKFTRGMSDMFSAAKLEEQDWRSWLLCRERVGAVMERQATPLKKEFDRPTRPA